MVTETNMVGNQMQVVLKGSIYVEDAKEMREDIISIIDKGQTSFVFDLSQVDYIDSTGLGMLVSIQKRVMLRGGSITIKGLQGLAKEVFELTRLTKVFEIH